MKISELESLIPGLQYNRSPNNNYQADNHELTMTQTEMLLRQYAELVISDEKAERPPSDTRLSMLENQLASILHDELCKKSWFHTHLQQFLETQLIDTIRTFTTKLVKSLDSSGKTSDIRKASGVLFEKTLQVGLQDFASLVFLTPAVIGKLYSASKANSNDFINQGIAYHCQIIRNAARSVARKHASGIGSFSIDLKELEDELWSCVLEEIVRTMTDMSARVWNLRDRTCITFPPKETRGRRRGYITHVAVSADGSKLATARSDQTLLIWDINSRSLLQSWNYASLFPELAQNNTPPDKIIFDAEGNKAALEINKKFVIIFQLTEGTLPINMYDEGRKDLFLQDFGRPYIPDPAVIDKTQIRIPLLSGTEYPLQDYLSTVLDWSWNKTGEILVTASEELRQVPDWIVDAGFERAVYHITKMRLIDLIRKHTHTDYVCWRCGSSNASRSDAQCPKCGADFSRCPLGCPPVENEPLSVENEWKCSRCGMASRYIQNQREVDESELQLSISPKQRDWSMEHDFERIFNALRHITIAYRGRQIPCTDLVLLKSKGKTNEEIGSEIGIPRGSVDYIWNQCRNEVLEILNNR